MGVHTYKHRHVASICFAYGVEVSELRGGGERGVEKHGLVHSLFSGLDVATLIYFICLSCFLDSLFIVRMDPNHSQSFGDPWCMSMCTSVCSLGCGLGVHTHCGGC